MKLTWLTDIHLNFLAEKSRIEFYNEIKNSGGDAIIISGDIAESASICRYLTEMKEYVSQPVYFVAGNHDYYHGSIADTQCNLNNLTREVKDLHWLGNRMPTFLENDIWLCGADGWADGRYGNFHGSAIRLNDSVLIEEFYQAYIVSSHRLLKEMQTRADFDADLIDDHINFAVQRRAKEIIIVTHVPPFRETALYEGKISGYDFLPFFASKATGDVLLYRAQRNPGVKLHVFCGHSHSKAFYHPLENLSVYVGEAKYYYPMIQQVLDLDEL